MPRSRSDPHGFRQEGKDLLRAIAGGSIVGMPLLYTMEMWYHGAILSPWHQLAVLGAILIVNFFFCVVSGFRHEDTTLEAAMQAVTSVGIALGYSTFILCVIGTIDARTSWGEAVGMILLEASAVSLGVSFADAHFRDRSRTGEQNDQKQGSKEKPKPKPSPQQLESQQLRADLVDLSATIVGSILFALNIAPTEEVLLIATRLHAWQLLAVLATTVALCYVILYASGFESQPVYVESVFQRAWAETAMTVAVSLLAGLGLTWLIGQRELFGDPASVLAATVVLGLPATVGGAAGRLIT